MRASGRLQCLYRQRFGHRPLPWLHGSRYSAPHRGGTGCTHTQCLRYRVQRQLDRPRQDRAASSPRDTVRPLTAPGVKEYQSLAGTNQKESLDSSSAPRRLQSCLDQLNEPSGLVQRTLSDPLTHRKGAIVRLVSAGLQVIQDAGDLTREALSPTDQVPGKLGSDLAMVPVLAFSAVVGESEEGSNRGLQGSKIGTTDTGIKSTMSSIPVCSQEIALSLSEEDRSHGL
jgi:hypothetical protein